MADKSQTAGNALNADPRRRQTEIGVHLIGQLSSMTADFMDHGAA
jgi:hypothetical protein